MPRKSAALPDTANGQLSSVLSLASVAHSVPTRLRRAERLAADLIDQYGLLLDEGGSGDADKYNAVFRLLDRAERTRYDANTAALNNARIQVEGKEHDGGAVACNAYTAVIDYGYYLGLAMGFKAAQWLGGAR